MLALLALSTALAGEITWTFEAEATAAVDSEYDGQLTLGTPLTGFITFDEPSDTGGTYPDAIQDAEFSFQGQTWTVNQGGAAAVQDGTSDSFNTAWSFRGPSLVGTDGRDLTAATLNIFVADAQGGLFDSRAFPTNPPDLSAIDTNQVIVRFDDSVGGGSPSAVFRITAWELVDGCPDSAKVSPGNCGCDYQDVEVIDGFACVHPDAIVDRAATLGRDVQIDQQAIVGAATIGIAGRVGRTAQIGDGTVLGDDCIVARSATIGSNATLGDGSIVQRDAQVGDDVTAGTDLFLGYGTVIQASSTLGDGVVFGSLVDAATVDIGDNVVVARAARIGAGSALGTLSIVGPDVQLGENVALGQRVRIRKQAQLGDRVTLGARTRIGRGTVLGDDSGTRENVTLRPEVELGTFAHLPADLFVPRGESYPNDYDHDDDGVLSSEMGGTDCNDFDARFIELCEIDLITVDGVRSWADGSFAQSCDDYRNPSGVETYGGDVGSGTYNIDPNNEGAPFAAYCDMATNTGWTLAAVVASGSGSSWTYDSAWWTVSGSARQSNPSPSASEARYQVFDASPYTAIRLVDPASGREVRLDDSAASLVSRFASTPPPELVSNGNGGQTQSGRTTIPHTRYDAQSFGFISNLNALDICGSSATSDVNGWVSGAGIGLNTAGAYNASNRLSVDGKARIGHFVAGSNSHIWTQTADCGLGLGVQTRRADSAIDSGTTMGTKTTVWVR